MNWHILILFCFVISTNGNTEVLHSPIAFAKFLQDSVESCNRLNVSETCCTSLDQYVKGFIGSEEWALRMFDSGSKIPSGIMEGKTGDLGVYDECMLIDNGEIQGQYCLGTFSVLKLAFCFPHTCSGVEMQTLLQSYDVPLSFKNEDCQTIKGRPEMDGLAIFTVVFLATIAGIMVLSTMYDVFNYYTKRETAHILLTAFSVFSNGRKILHVSNNPNQINCLHGLRVISIMWVILGHRYRMQAMEVVVTNGFEFLDWMQEFRSSYMFGAWASVETFFFMSGVVIAYSFTAAKEKGMKFNVLMYYVHRYIRLTPPYAALILINVSLMKHFADGPQWPERIENALEAPCRKWWWTSLLYVQNYVNYDEPCMGQTWYLSVDTQLFLVSPLILIPLWHWPKIKPYAMGVLVLVAALIPTIIGYVTETTFTTDLEKFDEYVRLLYYPAHARAVPWAIGLSTGYLVYGIKQSRVRLPFTPSTRNIIFPLLWIVALVVMAASSLGVHFVATGEYDRFWDSIYVGFANVGWSGGLLFVVVACVTGYAGPINWILSNPFMQVFSRLTYSTYLVHKLVLSVKIYTSREPLTFKEVDMMYIFWGDFVLSSFIAALWVLAFESPILILEKVLFGKGKENSASSKPDEKKENKA